MDFFSILRFCFRYPWQRPRLGIFWGNFTLKRRTDRCEERELIDVFRSFAGRVFGLGNFPIEIITQKRPLLSICEGRPTCWRFGSHEYPFPLLPLRLFCLRLLFP